MKEQIAAKVEQAVITHSQHSAGAEKPLPAYVTHQAGEVRHQACEQRQGQAAARLA